MDAPTLARDIAIVVAAFLIGGIPWGVIVARLAGGPDPRSIGSGHTGGANVARALGLRFAVVSGLLDVAKGGAAVLIARAFGAGAAVEVLAGLAAIVGHSRSPFLGFHGGRGVSPAFGGLLVIEPLVAIAIVPIFAIVFLASRYSSLASLTASAAGGIGLALIAALTGQPPAYYVFAAGGPVLIWLFHHDNIARLLAGTERRFGSSRGAR
ncbi:MAG: glycerol-3-phosphate 1-O-acyltransferase PlsY [Chloroflexi bacterium]|nr:glycerol-3-phosphate 1-O-acyltransferase PlsY [Chloroflexota bacterium]